MKEDLLRRLSYILAVLSIAIMAITMIYVNYGQLSPIVISIFSIVTALVGVSVSGFLYVNTIQTHPRALSIALIGPPMAGKTVYLTMLYRELEAGKVGKLVFSPYEKSTITRVSTDISNLEAGRFPPSTPYFTSFLYEAVASYGVSFLAKRYRIQFQDFGGEHLLDFDSNKFNEDLEKNDYLSYIYSSNALFFMIDSERIINNDENLPAIESHIVTLLQRYMSNINRDPLTPLEIPVSLIISKSDLIGSPENKSEFDVKLNECLPRLIAVCKARCRYFRIFTVSSLGITPSLPNAVPKNIHPISILDPLLWILRA